jgi:hypothetical protein
MQAPISIWDNFSPNGGKFARVGNDDSIGPRAEGFAILRAMAHSAAVRCAWHRARR